MEFAVCGDLYNHIVNKKRLEEPEAAFFFSQIICGLEVIHKNNIVHRDIKPENLLLKENKILTIIDFGLSNQYRKGELLSTPCGSPCYAAPEMILGRKYNGLMVDLWSSGIVLYAMVCGYLPFEDRNSDKLYKKILNGVFEVPEHLSRECRDLLSKILTVNPSKRIGLEDIKNHPFLALASPVYHVEDDDRFDTQSGKTYCEPVIEKMISNMPGFNFRREDIIFNLSHNKHNNITTTYELLLKKYKINNNLFNTSISGKEKNITATTSQQSISLNTTTSPIKASDDKMKVIFNKNNLPAITNYNKTNSNQRRLSVTVAKTSREKNYSRHQYNQLSNNISTYNKTLENNSSNKHNAIISKKNFKSKNINNSKNDISVSLDVSKIISKNKIDSNIIIGVPKLVPVNKKIFAKLNYKNNKFYYKEIKALNSYYRKNILNNSNSGLGNNNNRSSSKRRYSNSKNNAINTSVTYEQSPHRFDGLTQTKSKTKQMVYIPSNTINLADDNSNTIKKTKKVSKSKPNIRTTKSVIHYASFNMKKTTIPSSSEIKLSSNSIKSVKDYHRSQSLNEKENNLSCSNSVGCSSVSGSARKYLMTFSSENNNRNSNNNISSTSLGSNKISSSISNRTEMSHISRLFKTSNFSSFNSHNESHSKQKKRTIKTKLKNGSSTIKGKVTSVKCSSPVPKKAMNNKSNYCPSFTENMSSTPITIDRVLVDSKSNFTNTGIKKSSCNIEKTMHMSLGFKNTKTPIKKGNDVSVSIKKELNAKHLKKESIIRPISPVNLFTSNQKNNLSSKKENATNKKMIKTKPTVVGIDITVDISKGTPTKQKTKLTNRTSASNSQKNINVNLRTPKQQSSSKVAISNSKNKNKKTHIHTHDIGIVDLSTKAEKEHENKRKNKVPLEIKFDLEDDIEIKSKMLTSSKDFALCTTNSTNDEIVIKLNELCKENGLTLTEVVDKSKFICKKDSDNSINIEISSVGNNNVLKLYHLNGQESITKDMIKKIIITIGF